MNELTYNILILLRVYISLCFTVINIFVMTEYRVAKKNAYIAIVGVFAACIAVNTFVIIVYGFYVLSQVFLFTMTLPYIILLLVITKDNVFKSLFNFWAQVSMFWVVYVITNYLEYSLHIGIVWDLFVRGALYCALLYSYIKFIKKPYRKFANVVNGGWGAIATIPILFSTVLMLLCNFPTPINARPENYIVALVVIMLMLMTYFVAFLTVKNTYQLMLKSQYEQSLKLQIAMQKEQYNAVQEKMLMDQAFRHDIRHHANLLVGILSKKSIDEALEYTKKLGDYTLEAGQKNYCENMAANAVLSSYLSEATKRDIDITCHVVVPKMLNVDDIELCVVLANLLENAVEHCGGTASGLDISIAQNHRQLCIKLANTCAQEVKRAENGDYISTKPHGGIGLKSVRAIVKKYGGVMDITCEDNIFTVFATLNM